MSGFFFKDLLSKVYGFMTLRKISLWRHFLHLLWSASSRLEKCRDISGKHKIKGASIKCFYKIPSYFWKKKEKKQGRKKKFYCYALWGLWPLCLPFRSPAQGYSDQVILQARLLLANAPRWSSRRDQGRQH